jgi:hypothetical protein
MKDENINTYFKILSTNVLSLSIMYKTWNNEENRNIIIEINSHLVKNKNEFILCEKLGKCKEEFQLLESLCEHECIREKIKENLKILFS